MNEPVMHEERKFESGRAAKVTLLVALLLFAFSASGLYMQHAGRVGYGWVTLSASLFLIVSGLATWRGWTWCVYLSALVLTVFDFVWMVRILKGFDMGLAIWIGICFFAIRELWPGLDNEFPWLKRNP